MNTATNFNHTQPRPEGLPTGAPQSTQVPTTGPASPNAHPYDDPNYAPGAVPTHPDRLKDDQMSAGDSMGSASYGKAAGKGVRSVFKGIHGIGETIRGNILEAVDEAFGDKRRSAQHENIARIGNAEMMDGKHSTTLPERY